jgi:hypothetical protein
MVVHNAEGPRLRLSCISSLFYSFYNLYCLIRLGFADRILICSASDFSHHCQAKIVYMPHWRLQMLTILRKQSQYEPLRNVISGLRFAVLY